MSVLVVGSVAFDSIETPNGALDDALGGSASYFSYAASFFTQPRMVGVVGADFPEEHKQLFKSRKIDTEGLVTVPDGKTVSGSQPAIGKIFGALADGVPKQHLRVVDEANTGSWTNTPLQPAVATTTPTLLNRGLRAVTARGREGGLL